MVRHVPMPPFTRVDAIYFLFQSGRIVTENTDLDPYITGRTMQEALTTIGVSHEEIRRVVNMTLENTPSHWEKIPADTDKGNWI